MLHFIAFLQVASLVHKGTHYTTEKWGVDYKKALALDNRIFFFKFQPDFNVEVLPKTSCCIVAWSRQTFWFKLNFFLPKNESILNILVYFSRLKASHKSIKLFSNICTLKCSQLISSSDTKKMLLTEEMSGWIQAAMQQNTNSYCIHWGEFISVREFLGIFLVKIQVPK